MSLAKTLQKAIIRLTDQHWTDHLQGPAFAELIQGKEPGHRMADYVDDQITSLLKVQLDTRYEADTKGQPKKRSMGDVWVHSNRIYNPVNVKSGLQGMQGQPNVVSMQKLLDYIFKSWIDSYYLLIIKFDLDGNVTHNSYLIDLLEWTDFITYDAGPGQIMLREQEFYSAFDTGHAPGSLSIAEKVERLFKRFEDGVRSLFTNRKQRLERQKALFKNFSRETFKVDQSGMKFVP